MTVEIDRNSGFCGGVIRAIEGAEKLLAENGLLYSLGAIVHNEAELARLHQKGLITVYKENFKAETGAFPAEPFFGEDGNDAGAAPRILLIREATSSSNHLGVEVAPHTPTLSSELNQEASSRLSSSVKSVMQRSLALSGRWAERPW